MATISKKTKNTLWNMFNEKTLELTERADGLRELGFDDEADATQQLINELDAVAKELGIID